MSCLGDLSLPWGDNKMEPFFTKNILGCYLGCSNLYSAMANNKMFIHQIQMWRIGEAKLSQTGRSLGKYLISE